MCLSVNGPPLSSSILTGLLSSRVKHSGESPRVCVSGFSVSIPSPIRVLIPELQLLLIQMSECQPSIPSLPVFLSSHSSPFLSYPILFSSLIQTIPFIKSKYHTTHTSALIFKSQQEICQHYKHQRAVNPNNTKFVSVYQKQGQLRDRRLCVCVTFWAARCSAVL